MWNLALFLCCLRKIDDWQALVANYLYISIVCKMPTLLVDSKDSVLTFDISVPSKNEQFGEWVVDEWIHFYDAVSLTPNVKKSYDLKFFSNSVKLYASFHAHVDNFADLFNEEALHHLEEVAHVCDEDTFYVQAPYKEETDGPIKHEPIFTHYVRVGKGVKFACCFGGEGETSEELLPPVKVAQVVRSSERKKAEERCYELGRMAHELGKEVRQLKEEVSALQAKIAEKEGRIRMYEYAQEELMGVCENDE